MRQPAAPLAAALLVVVGCSTTPEPTPVASSVPFRYAGRHLLVVPVQVADSHATRFIFDTGIGVTLLDRPLAERLGCIVDGSYTGKRMSGQEVTVPLATLSALSIAGVRATGVRVGVWEMQGFLEPGPELEGVEGFLSLNALERTPFTLDYARGHLVIEDEAGLAARVAAGRVIPLEVVVDGTCVTVFFQLDVPGGAPARVELDLGGNILTLDARYMSRLGIDPLGPGVRREERKDETGFDYLRFFARTPGPVAPHGAPELAQRDLDVMFQDIIYDGLVGNDFLKRFTVTYDLPGRRLVLGPRTE